ncbi:hypothetical protein [Streptomyces decoyicus]|uniref:hypothetical protein n=1 Tax=Streptomyces decoyicus TaxID=249567 RepID=UPI003656EE79
MNPAQFLSEYRKAAQRTRGAAEFARDHVAAPGTTIALRSIARNLSTVAEEFEAITVPRSWPTRYTRL